MRRSRVLEREATDFGRRRSRKGVGLALTSELWRIGKVASSFAGDSYFRRPQPRPRPWLLRNAWRPFIYLRSSEELLS